jgi:2-polyprenyl-3-methyl-5-hydroxy-6-metoxy-1,4-benzoquinol methylase
MSEIDVGKYHDNEELYLQEVKKIYEAYPEGVKLTPEYAQFIQENQLRFLIRLARYKFVTKMLKPQDTVMEVGSGSGMGSIFLGQHCTSVLGIDVKQTEIDEACALNQRSNVRFKLQDLFDPEFDEKFDVVVSLDVIEHMPVEDGNRFIEAKVQHLKEDGMLIIGTPSIWSYEHQSPISKASHVKCYDLPELKELVDQYVGRSITFSMNDELVHTGFHKMAWYYFIIGFGLKD